MNSRYFHPELEVLEDRTLPSSLTLGAVPHPSRAEMAHMRGKPPPPLATNMPRQEAVDFVNGITPVDQLGPDADLLAIIHLEALRNWLNETGMRDLSVVSSELDLMVFNR